MMSKHVATQASRCTTSALSSSANIYSVCYDSTAPLPGEGRLHPRNRAAAKCFKRGNDEKNFRKSIRMKSRHYIDNIFSYGRQRRRDIKLRSMLTLNEYIFISNKQKKNNKKQKKNQTMITK